jgi:hypothetical protein
MISTPTRVHAAGTVLHGATPGETALAGSTRHNLPGAPWRPIRHLQENDCSIAVKPLFNNAAKRYHNAYDSSTSHGGASTSSGPLYAAGLVLVRELIAWGCNARPTKAARCGLAAGEFACRDARTAGRDRQRTQVGEDR